MVARLIGGLALLAAACGAVWGAVHALADRGQKAASQVLTHRVARGDLLVTVTEDGNLESAVNIDIKCEVAGGTSILWIVEDGKEVTKGEKLVELDSSALEESINQQRIATEKARAAKIQAEKDFAAAKLGVDEYLQGTFVQSVQNQDAQITIAEENLRSAQNSLEHSERMFRKGYISALDLESQRFQVQRAQLELDSARTAKDVLVTFSKVKTLQELESKRDSAEAKMRSESASFDLEELRLKRLEGQLEKCLILAPADGMAVYANDQGMRFGPSQQSTIEEGASVRERQTILRLPDLAKMQVKVTVHESKVEMLSRAWRAALDANRALRARIRIQNEEFQGNLLSIANQPEPSAWYAGNIKEYATIISIDGQPKGLRPGMTAECEILAEHLTHVLSVPVAAVVEQRGSYFAWVETPQGPERRPLLLGANNDQFIEVKDGLLEGDLVILNPRAVVADARAIKEAAEDVDVTKKFGEEREAPAAKLPNGRPGAPGAPGTAGGSGVAPDTSAGGAGGPGAPGGRGKAGRRPGRNLMQFDTDGDGKLSREELPEQARGFFDQMDRNRDGLVDRSELAEVQRHMQGAGPAEGRPGAAPDSPDHASGRSDGPPDGPGRARPPTPNPERRE